MEMRPLPRPTMCCRGGKLEGYFKFKGSQYDPASVAFQYQFSLNGEALVDAATVFKPPCLLE